MKNNIKFLLIGLIIGVIIATTSVFGLTGAVQKTLEYNNIKIRLNGNEITPTDANGTYVEPFTIDGTTYLPVRALANALGLAVDWDETTSTVILGKDTSASESNEGAIYDKDGIKVYFNGIAPSVFYDDYNLLIENNSSEIMYINGQDIYVNGYAMNSFSNFNAQVDPGKKAVREIRIRHEQLHQSDILNVEKIEFKLYVHTPDSTDYTITDVEFRP